MASNHVSHSHATDAVDRRLAAVVSIDVVGYSRLTERDEEATVRRLKTYIDLSIQPIATAHGGRIVKLMGDGVLLEFPSVVEAVRCALELQQTVTNAEASRAAEEKIRYRMGIHLGDVIVDGGDIKGHGVNVAARLESLAAPDGICISEAVRAALSNSIPLVFQDMGVQHVKNIAEPVHVFQIRPGMPGSHGSVGNSHRLFSLRRLLIGALLLSVIAAAGIYLGYGQRSFLQNEKALQGGTAPLVPTMTASPGPSIIVLPFTNLSAEKDQEFFVDGLTEDVIIDLSGLSGLFVISRNTAFSYKNQNVRPQQIAADLHVAYLLNGSVRRVANRVRITAQLIDAQNDRQIWAGRYDRELTDIFAVQDEVKKEIIAALKVELTPDERRQVDATPTRNVEAYEFYLRGRYAMNLLTRRSLRLAYYAFEQAIARDPNFAEAQAELAMTYALDYTGTSNAWYDWVRSPGRARSQAELLARKAAALNSGLATPELVLARLALAEWRFNDALDHAHSAVGREPGNPETYATLALVLTATGRHAEAKQAIDEALRRDPKAVPSTYATLGIIQFAQHDYQAASTSLERSFKEMIDGGNWFFDAFLIAADAYRGSNSAILKVRKEIFWGTGIAAVRFSHFYSDDDDMEHLLQGLRLAGVPEFPPEFNPKEESAVPVTGSALKNLLGDHAFDTLCWNPRLNGQFHFFGNNLTWTMRHDLTDTGKSRIDGDTVCVTMPVITRNREACYSVFKVKGDNQLTQSYDYAFAGPMLCYFKEKN